MPIYEYRCQSCGKEMEATQRIVDPPLTECPACHKPALERLISATSFQLKGSGWYKDGYGAKKSGAVDRTENDRGDRLDKAIKDDKATTDAKPDGKSDSVSKPEGKPEGKSDTKAEPASTSTSASGPKDSGPAGGKVAAA